MPEEPSASETPIPDDAAEYLVAAYEDARDTSSGEAKAAAMMSDDFFLRAYERTSGEEASLEADALLAKLKERGLDI